MDAYCSTFELALCVGCCVVISSPDGVEWFTARVEEVCRVSTQQVVPVSGSWISGCRILTLSEPVEHLNCSQSLKNRTQRVSEP